MSESDSVSNISNSEHEKSDFDKNEKSCADVNNTNQKNSLINNLKQSSIHDKHEESSTSTENSSADSSTSDNINNVQQNHEKTTNEKKKKEPKDKTKNENQQKDDKTNEEKLELKKPIEKGNDESNDKERKKKQKRKSLEVKSNSNKSDNNIDKTSKEKKKIDNEVSKPIESNVDEGNQKESELKANNEEIPKMSSVPQLRSSIRENGESELNFPVKKRKSTVTFEFPALQDDENKDNIKMHTKKRSKSDDDIRFPKLEQNDDDDDKDDICDAASEPMGKGHTRAKRLSSSSGKIDIDPRNIPRRFSKMTIEQIDQVIKTEDELLDAITFFNKNKDPSKLCEYYDVDETPENIAQIFWGTQDINSSILGQYLIKKKDVLDAYFMEVEMDKGPIQSLRNALLGPMRFDGESQTVHKVLSSISRCYALKNPDKCEDPDHILDLYYALIMLNTDLSNPNNKKKMTLQEFIRNTKGANDYLSTIADEELTRYYKNIQKKPILFQNQSDDFVYDFCPKIRGYLKKKSIHTFGTWTKKYFVLINSILYYFRDDNPENAKEPLGAVYLKGVEPIRDRDNTPLLIRIIAKKKELKYAKFTNGQKDCPRYVKGIKEIILEAPDRASSSKWYHRIRVTAQMSNFLKEKKVEIVQEKNIYETDVPDAADDSGEECDQ